jgi:chorismate mutase
LAQAMSTSDNNSSTNKPAQLSSLRISQLRKEIDAIDESICQLLIRRMELAVELGDIKEELSLPVRDPARESKVYEKVANMAERSKHKDEIVAIYHAIISESCRVQIEKEKNDP